MPEKRLHSDIIKIRRIDIVNRSVKESRIKIVRIKNLGNNRSKLHKVTTFTEMERTRLKGITTGKLTSKRTKRARSVTSASSLIENISTERNRITT